MPVVIVLIMVFSRQTKMAELYGIRDNEMGYYLAFALVILPFSLLMDVFVLNTQEVRPKCEYCSIRMPEHEHCVHLCAHNMRRPHLPSSEIRSSTIALFAYVIVAYQ